MIKNHVLERVLIIIALAKFAHVQYFPSHLEFHHICVMVKSELECIMSCAAKKKQNTSADHLEMYLAI